MESIFSNVSKITMEKLEQINRLRTSAETQFSKELYDNADKILTFYSSRSNLNLDLGYPYLTEDGICIEYHGVNFTIYCDLFEPLEEPDCIYINKWKNGRSINIYNGNDIEQAISVIKSLFK